MIQEREWDAKLKDLNSRLVTAGQHEAYQKHSLDLNRPTKGMGIRILLLDDTPMRVKAGSGSGKKHQSKAAYLWTKPQEFLQLHCSQPTNLHKLLQLLQCKRPLSENNRAKCVKYTDSVRCMKYTGNLVIQQPSKHLYTMLKSFFLQHLLIQYFGSISTGNPIHLRKQPANQWNHLHKLITSISGRLFLKQDLLCHCT